MNRVSIAGGILVGICTFFLTQLYGPTFWDDGLIALFVAGAGLGAMLVAYSDGLR